MTVGLLLVVNATETAGNVVVVDKAEYLSYTYNDTPASAVLSVKQDDIAHQQNVALDKWTVTWKVIAADIATYRGYGADTLATMVKSAVNAVTDPDAV